MYGRGMKRRGGPAEWPGFAKRPPPPGMGPYGDPFGGVSWGGGAPMYGGQGPRMGWRAPTPSRFEDFSDDSFAIYGTRGRGRGVAIRGARGGQTATGQTAAQGQSQGQGQTTTPTPTTTQQGGTTTNRGGQTQFQRGGQNWGQRGARGQGYRGRGQNPGMSPTMFGRGRGKSNGSDFMPPVHSKAKVNVVDTAALLNMSTAEKIHRFCLFLKSDETIPVNAIQKVQNAITSTKTGMKVNYEAEELAKVAGKSMYTGSMGLDGVFMSRGIGPNKKELKREIYQKALDVMMSKTVAEIYNLVDPGADAIRQELMNTMKEETDKQALLNSLAADNITVQVQKVAPTAGVLVENLDQCLTLVINTIKMMKVIPESPISVIDQARSMSKCPVPIIFRSEEVKFLNGRMYHEGNLWFGSVVIGRGKGMIKKVCKADTYTMALERLKTLPVTDLLVSVPELPKPNFDMPTTVKTSFENSTLEEKFSALKKAIGEMTLQDNIVQPMDILCMQYGLTPMCVYRSLNPVEPGGDKLSCELHLDKILIASGDGKTRRECQIEAYTSAYEILMSSDVETLLTQHKRVNENEIQQPDVIDIWVKGTGRSIESNIAGLRRYKHEDTDSLSKDRLVLIEHADVSKNRFLHSFCILHYSATQNGMLLQWNTEGYKKMFRCTMLLQKQEVGWSLGRNKNHARNLAASDALHYLYAIQPVVRVSKRDDSSIWTLWETIVNEGKQLKKIEDGDEEDSSDTEDKNKNTKSSLSEEFFNIKAVVERMKKFADEKRSSEIIIGPGFSTTEGKEIQLKCRDLQIQLAMRQHEGELYMIMFKRLPWYELVQTIKATGKPYGKYELVPQDELPSHESIEHRIIREVPDLKVDEEMDKA